VTESITVASVRQRLNEAAATLAKLSDTPRLDAELLLAHALGVSREAVLLGDHDVPPGFDTLIARRLRHEPVAYITGKRDFWTVSLQVTHDVLIPRPDSETLIEAAVAHFGPAGPKRVLDLGTGSGALLLAALDQWPEATGVGIDASEPALAVARRNAAVIAPDRAEIRGGGWTGTGEVFDLIVCNPPYIATGERLPPDVTEWEPHAALFAGDDGLNDYRAIAPALGGQLAPRGLACLEIGHRQRVAVTVLFENAGLTVTCRKDLAGRDRCLEIMLGGRASGG